MEEDKNTTFFKNTLVTTYPNIAEITFTSIDKKYLKVLLINFCLVAIILVALVFSITQINFEEIDLQKHTSLIYTVLALVLLVNTILILVGFKKRKYAVREKDISYKQGVLVSKLVTVPYNRIQHLNITETFFLRLFKLASLHIYTAGDDASDLVIKGLPKKRAYEIREYILQKTKSL